MPSQITDRISVEHMNATAATRGLSIHRNGYKQYGEGLHYPNQSRVLEENALCHTGVNSTNGYEDVRWDFVSIETYADSNVSNLFLNKNNSTKINY